MGSSPDNDGAGQHCQMARRPASKAERRNESEPVVEPAQAWNQLQPGGYGLGSGVRVALRVCETTPTSVFDADQEATVKACGVVVARPQRHSWASILPTGTW